MPFQCVCTRSVVSDVFATPWTVAYQAPQSTGFSGKNIWVCCHFLVVIVLSHVQLCDPVDCSRPHFPVLCYLPEFAQIHAISYSKGSSLSRDVTWVSCVSCIGRWGFFVYHWATWQAPEISAKPQKGNTNRLPTLLKNKHIQISGLREKMASLVNHFPGPNRSHLPLPKSNFSLSE